MSLSRSRGCPPPRRADETGGEGVARQIYRAAGGVLPLTPGGKGFIPLGVMHRLTPGVWISTGACVTKGNASVLSEPVSGC